MTGPSAYSTAQSMDMPFGPDAQGPLPTGDVPVDYTKAMIPLRDEQRDALVRWLDQWIKDLEAMQADKVSEWSLYETAYRARQGEPSDSPFIGHNVDTVPVIAMAVEPVHARLETGIFKQDPFIHTKPIRKRAKQYALPLQHWLNFYFTKVVNLQQVSAPALLECAKLGTMVFKVPFVNEKCRGKRYSDKGKVEEFVYRKFYGPRPERVSLDNFLVPPHIQYIQDSPIVVERQRTTYESLKELEFNGYLTNVSKVREHTGGVKPTELEDAREDMANHVSSSHTQLAEDEIVVYECWFVYNLSLTVEDTKTKETTERSYPVKLVATYEPNSRQLLQLRYNPYFHQHYPYVVIPYTITTDSVYGIGIGEMSYTFQNSITQSHRNALDNSYLANMRGFIKKRGSAMSEEPIRIHAGMTLFADDAGDIKPFQLGDTYYSTIQERQNLFGMVEKRTGVSDYMTGRESPALGSRATATSTLALIQEGTRRVEQVMGNLRSGYNELFRMCMMCWAQYGLGDYDDYMFEGEETGTLLDQFFKTVVDPSNIATLMSIDIGVTDATTNRQIQQQMQLALIQLMTQYLTQVLQAGQLAIQAVQQGMPQVQDLVVAILKSAQLMYRDLLSKYDIPGAEEYLPDVISIITAQGGSPPAGLGGGSTGIPGQLPAIPGMGVSGGPPQGTPPEGLVGAAGPGTPAGQTPLPPGAV
jgi:hypothetical protein